MTMRWFLLLLSLFLAGCFADAEVLVHESGTVGPEPVSRAKSFIRRRADSDRPLGVGADIQLSRGTATLTLATRDDEPFFRESFEPGSKARGALLPPDSASDELDLVVEFDEAVGSWEISLVRVPPAASFYIFAASGPLVLVVVALALWLARRRFRAKLRWLWVGAGLWTVAVALKGTSDYLLTKSALAGLDSMLPRWAYLPAGSAYIGLHSAVFEVGLTVLAALIWRRLARDSSRSINIGLGAGVFEAFLVGLFTIVAVVPLLRGNELTLIGATLQAAATPAVWLVAAVERALTIPVHVASRALVFYGIAAGRTKPLLFGFLLFAGLDTVAGVAVVAELSTRVSLWWIELAVLPFSVLSMLTVGRLARAWPSSPASASET